MRSVVLLFAAALIVALPAQAELVNIEVTGEVEWNQARSWPLTDVNVGDRVTMKIQVDSDNYMNSPNFPTRGYEIDQATWSITMGSVTIGMYDPYPSWYTPPYFVLRNNDPASDGFFVTSGQVDWPFPGLITEVWGFCGQFETHYDVSYTEETLSSLDILDAVGTYTYDGLTRFYFNEVDCGFEVIGMILEQTTISRVPVEVPVDIKPGSCPNPLNGKSRGVTPAAILGAADLDVTTIDPTSIRLNGVAPIRSDYEDVGTPFAPYVGKADCDADCNEMEADGWNDLTLKFDTVELMASLADADDSCMALTLTGNFTEEYGGGPIVGEDVVNVKFSARVGMPEDSRLRDRMGRTGTRPKGDAVDMQRRD